MFYLYKSEEDLWDFVYMQTIEPDLQMIQEKLTIALQEVLEQPLKLKAVN